MDSTAALAWQPASSGDQRAAGEWGGWWRAPWEPSRSLSGLRCVLCEPAGNLEHREKQMGWMSAHQPMRGHLPVWLTHKPLRICSKAQPGPSNARWVTRGVVKSSLTGIYEKKKQHRWEVRHVHIFMVISLVSALIRKTSQTVSLTLTIHLNAWNRMWHHSSDRGKGSYSHQSWTLTCERSAGLISGTCSERYL